MWATALHSWYISVFTFDCYLACSWIYVRGWARTVESFPLASKQAISASIADSIIVYWSPLPDLD